MISRIMPGPRARRCRLQDMDLRAGNKLSRSCEAVARGVHKCHSYLLSNPIGFARTSCAWVVRIVGGCPCLVSLTFSFPVS